MYTVYFFKDSSLINSQICMAGGEARRLAITKSSNLKCIALVTTVIQNEVQIHNKVSSGEFDDIDLNDYLSVYRERDELSQK